MAKQAKQMVGTINKPATDLDDLFTPEKAETPRKIGSYDPVAQNGQNWQAVVESDGADREIVIRIPLVANGKIARAKCESGAPYSYTTKQGRMDVIASTISRFNDDLFLRMPNGKTAKFSFKLQLAIKATDS